MLPASNGGFAAPMTIDVLVLPGDGIGPEVTAQAVRVLRAVVARSGHSLALLDGLIGGAAIEAGLGPLPDRTRALALETPAVLLGAVGLPACDLNPPERRPERGLLDLRQALGVFANLRPARTWPTTARVSPLKADIVEGTDLLIVRELTSGLYYGTPRGCADGPDGPRAFNTMSYTRTEIERVARTAFDVARTRRHRLTSVDKANVLETSQLWRKTVTEIGSAYPDVALDHLYVDNCAMQLVLNPSRFDVVLTENLFGDILSDEAAVLGGSIGMLPSASLGRPHSGGGRVGLYEPVHGSAPDIAGQNRANPLGAIGAVAMMLRYSFGLDGEAARVDDAIERVVSRGIVTADMRPDGPPASTSAVGDAVCEVIG